MQRFYERLNVDRERALEELPDLYTDDIAFFCPMETRYGLATFKRSWEFAFASYKMFEFHDFTLVDGSDNFALFYTMKVQMRVGRPMETPVGALFRVRDGKCHEQIDYWDNVGGVASIWVPAFRGYRWAVSKLLSGGRSVEGTPGRMDPIR
ncbi:MAG: nuclear transport factor 2 family protein [Myxococcales bacterium]|nr:nuclear transport factor 2 family protein [Myxococcales bacterium]